MAFSLYGFIKGLLLQDENDRTKELAITIDPSATTGTRTTLVAVQTANRTITLPDSSSPLINANSTDTLTNKTIDADLNTILNIDNNEIKAAAGIDASKIANASVSNAEYQRLDGVTSNIQTQLDNAVNGTATVQANLDNHINDATDAHDASAISNIPSGNVTSTDVQAAVNELQDHIDAISSGTSTASNLGSGTGLFAAKVVNDLQFKSLVAGTNITLSNTSTEVTINAAGSSGANTTLSNLTSPTAINQDLIAVTGSTFALETQNLTSGGVSTKDITVQSGAASGSALNTGAATFQSGNNTVASQSSGAVSVLSGTGAGSGVITVASGNTTSGGFQSGQVNVSSGTTNSSGIHSGQVIVESGASSNSGGGSGNVTLRTGSAGTIGSGDLTVSTGTSTGGVSGAINISTGSAASANHNSGNITLSTGTVSGTGVAGNIVLNSNINQNNFIIQAVSNITPATTENALAIIGPVHTFTPSGTTTLNGIAAGTVGQRLTLINNSGTSITFVNLSGTPPSNNRINTCTGANIVTGTGGTASVVELIYLTGAWTVTSFNI